MDNFSKNFTDYVCSGHAMLSIATYEKDRCIEQIKKVAKEINSNVFRWSIATGWILSHDNSNPDEKVDGTPVSEDSPATNPEAAIEAIASMDDGSILVLKDFGVYLHKDTYGQFDIVTSLLDNLKQLLSNRGKTIVFLGSGFKSPDVLKHDITEVDFSLPDRGSIEEQIAFVCDGVELADGSKFEANKDKIIETVYACQGMTEQRVLDSVSLALRKHKNLNELAVKTIVHEKASVIRSSGILDFIEPPSGGLDIVGGYDALKDHIRLDKPCFSDEARDFGIDFPKGLMFVGVPGCGKTLLAMAIASEFGFPMVSLDVGSLMGSLVGESESNMREAIRVLEGVSPCVCLLDEIEKGFSGNNGLDGGSSKRVFGTFLKWLNDRTSPVYVIATANEVQSLPPELSRKGRFDEIFGLDLPSEEDRAKIFVIQLSKRERDGALYDCRNLAKMSEGFTGADIEQAVKMGLKIAFRNKRKDNQEDMELAVSSIIPLSKTEPERINGIRDWCSKHAKAANTKVVKTTESTKRRVSIA